MYRFCLRICLAVWMLSGASLTYSQDTDGRSAAPLAAFKGRLKSAPDLNRAVRALDGRTMADRIKPKADSSSTEKPRVVIGKPPSEKPAETDGSAITVEGLQQILSELGYDPQPVEGMDGFTVVHEYQDYTVNVIAGIFLEAGTQYLACLVSTVNVQQQTPPLWVPFMLLDVNLMLAPDNGFTVDEESMILFCVTTAPNAQVTPATIKALVSDVSTITVDTVDIWHPDSWNE